LELGFLKFLGLDLGLGFFLKPKYFWILGYGFELGFFRFLGLDLVLGFFLGLWVRVMGMDSNQKPKNIWDLKKIRKNIFIKIS